ncbi:MAG: hypothetical protein KGH60_04595 [Candidatus Micrarchaeota archaeon]|nr:hypothetical protein [Candidatus Micrarchaeota archaeon]
MRKEKAQEKEELHTFKVVVGERNHLKDAVESIANTQLVKDATDLESFSKALGKVYVKELSHIITDIVYAIYYFQLLEVGKLAVVNTKLDGHDGYLCQRHSYWLSLTLEYSHEQARGVNLYVHLPDKYGIREKAAELITKQVNRDVEKTPSGKDVVIRYPWY